MLYVNLNSSEVENVPEAIFYEVCFGFQYLSGNNVLEKIMAVGIVQDNRSLQNCLAF